VFLRHAAAGKDLLDDGRIGLQRHVGTLSEDCRKGHFGKEARDEFRGSLLELVRGHGQLHAVLREFGQQLRNASIGFRMAVDVVDIVLHEVGTRRRHVVGRTQLLGQRPLHKAQDAVADKVAILLVGVLRKPPQGQHGVAGNGQVADRIEQRAVEVEDD